jgi:ethanolamine ammonia-lyase large subunit
LRADATRADALYAVYMKAGGDARSSETLRDEGVRKMKELRGRGLDLGYGHDEDFAAPPEVELRLEAIYRHARHALHASIDEAVLGDVSPRHIQVRTRAADREEYLSRAQTGELICDADAARLVNLYASRRPQVQIVISDGLNANAHNESLRAVLPRLRREISSAGLHLGETDVVIRNGRVRAGYHVGALLDVKAIVHLIGERPGTGLNTLSAYLTYGRDAAGRSLWSPALDHACTTAICGIHSRDSRCAAAADEIARCLGRMFGERRSGVVLGHEASSP